MPDGAQTRKRNGGASGFREVTDPSCVLFAEPGRRARRNAEGVSNTRHRNAADRGAQGNATENWTCDWSQGACDGPWGGDSLAACHAQIRVRQMRRVLSRQLARRGVRSRCLAGTETRRLAHFALDTRHDEADADGRTGTRRQVPNHRRWSACVPVPWPRQLLRHLPDAPECLRGHAGGRRSVSGVTASRGVAGPETPRRVGGEWTVAVAVPRGTHLQSQKNPQFPGGGAQ